MKFIISKNLIILYCVCFTIDSYLSIKTNLQAAFKSKAGASFPTQNELSRKSNQLNLVDFFSKAGTGQIEKEQEEIRTLEEKRKRMSQYSFKSTPINAIVDRVKSTTEIKLPDVLASERKAMDDKEISLLNSGSEILAEWWTISSTLYRQGHVFPAVNLPENAREADGSTEITIVDNFRVNFASSNCTDPSKPTDDIWFYFRLNDKQVWYTTTGTDLNVLDSFFLEDVATIGENSFNYKNILLHCILLTDKAEKDSSKTWQMCHFDHKIYLTWMCKIKAVLKMADSKCESNPEDVTFKPPKTQDVIQPEVVIPLPSRQCNDRWNYGKNGDDWECVCAEGKEQSPIDLPSIDKTVPSPVKPLFQYQDVSKGTVNTVDNLIKEGQNLSIWNQNGFLELLDYDFGKLITLDGAVYRAERVTFHTPSNHKINGKQYPMEMSIIHYGISKGDIAKQVVLNFLFEKKSGVYNMFIDDINFFDLPNPVTQKVEFDGTLFIPKILYNTVKDNNKSSFHMKPFSFYTYQGSLMFPPCTENTIQYVASQPLPLGSTVLTLFEEALRVPDMASRDSESGNLSNVYVSDNLPTSNRNVQDRNGRPVYYYDYTQYCLAEPEEEAPKPQGHYEKMEKQIKKYIFVTGDRPSNIPGAYVVPEKEALGTTKNGAKVNLV